MHLLRFLRGTLETREAKAGGHGVFLDWYEAVDYFDVKWEWYSNFGTDHHHCGRVSWLQCIGENGAADLFRARDCFDVSVHKCFANHIGDDPVAVHTNDAAVGESVIPGRVRTRISVTNNHFIDCKPIKVLGARVLDVSHNLLERMRINAIEIGAGTTEGHVPEFSLRVVDNQILDLINGFTADTAGFAGIVIEVPAVPRGSAATSDVVPMRCNGSGAFIFPWDYRDVLTTDTDNAIAPTPDIEISGNTIARTLPAVANYSDWGFGECLESGVFYDIAITEDMLRPSLGLYFGTEPGFHRMRIADNKISHTKNCMQMPAPTSILSYRLSGNVS